MDVDCQQQQAQRPQSKCFKCNRLGHYARDYHSRLNVRAMTYDEMQEYFEQAEAAWKDCKEIKQKEDFVNATQ